MAEAQDETAQVGSLEGKITPEESQFFRRMRRIELWLFLATFTAACFAQKFEWMRWVFAILLAQTFIVVALVTFWPCPRCHSLFSVRFSLFYGISWPWVNHCMHCDAELLKK